MGCKKMKMFRKMFGVLFVVMLITSLFVITASAEGADPSGASYIATTGSETLDDVATIANKAYFGANYTWIMICAFMVFFFQCGFAMVETGFTRAKNAGNIIMKNFVDFMIGSILFFCFGFAFIYFK